jgi:hypothetical protein
LSYVPHRRFHAGPKFIDRLKDCAAGKHYFERQAGGEMFEECSSGGTLRMLAFGSIYFYLRRAAVEPLHPFRVTPNHAGQIAAPAKLPRQPNCKDSGAA